MREAMKNQIFAAAIAACLTTALISPIPAPADPIAGQVAAPVAKTKRILPAIGRANAPMTHSFIARPPPATAPTEACVFDDNYSTGASNNGTTFCTNKLGFQALPPERQGRISAATVPQGYTMVLYERVDRTGRSCRLIGDNAGLDPTCDDMARAVSLEADTAATLAQAQNEKARSEQASQDRAVRAGEEWAANIEATRQAQIAEQRAQEEREAELQATRAEIARVERERRQEQDERERRMIEVRNASLALTGDCPVLLRNYDGSVFSAGAHKRQRCVPLGGGGASWKYVGDDWNDTIEYVVIANPYIRVRLFKDRDYGGPSISLYCGEYELIDEPENEVSSIIVDLLDRPFTCTTGESIRRTWDR
jgi:hypothetical protein